MTRTRPPKLILAWISVSIFVNQLSADQCDEFCRCIPESGLRSCMGFFDGLPCSNIRQCSSRQLSTPAPTTQSPESLQQDLADAVPLNDGDFQRGLDLDTIAGQGSLSKALAAKHEASPHYFEGDIIGHTFESIQKYVQESNQVFEFIQQVTDHDFNGQARDVPAEIMRAALRDERAKWPGAVVPYAIHKSYSAKQRAVIASAMRHISERTCVQFEYYENGKHQNYIYIWPGSAGVCAAEVGRQFNRGSKQQALILGTYCFYSVGTIIHELMHSLGFFHEQSRNDRDQYVTIYWDNMSASARYNFQKYDLKQITHLGVPYDYGSIMHYGTNYFGKRDARGNTLKTIVPRQSGAKIGQRDGMSQYDIEKVNRLYCPTWAGGGGNGNTIGGSTAKPAPICLDTYEFCTHQSSIWWCTNQEGSTWNLWMRKKCPLTCRVPGC